MKLDPSTTNPDKYKVVFENERIRVLEYRDTPGAITTPHDHPDSVMVTLSEFKRKLHINGGEQEVNKKSGEVSWLPAQRHVGENIGDTDTHVILVELKDA